MKKILIFMVCFTISTFVYSQKKSWTIYSPVMSNVIGKSFVGSNPLDAKVLNNNKEVTFETERGPNTFNEEGKRAATFGLNSIFSKQSVRIFDINAYGVQVDLISLDALYHDINTGVDFVYGGLRADSVTIMIRRAKNSNLNTEEIISKLKEMYPSISEDERLSELINFFNFKTDSKDSTDIDFTIKDSSVYFLVQVAKFELKSRTRDINWDRKCSSYQNIDNIYADKITLINESGNKSFKTAITTPKFSRMKRGSEAQTWLEISEDNTELLFKYKTNYSARERSIPIPSRRDVWNENKYFIFRYPFSNTRNNIRFKDVLLTIDAVKNQNKIVITSNAIRKTCGSTYLNYPESKLSWIEFRQ